MQNLTADQNNVITEFSSFLLDPNRKVFVINGRPGCGKTYLIPHLISQAEAIRDLLNSLLNDKNNLSFYLTATTNQAAEVLTEKTGRPATTIHSFLGLRVTDDYSTGKTYLRKTNSWKVHSNVILFVDEMSMANAELLSYIEQSTINCKVVYILDKNQILPVFENSIPITERYPVSANLTQIVRQGAGNPIIQYAHMLCDAIENKTKIPQIPNNQFMVHLSNSDFKAAINTNFVVPDAEHKYRIICWTNKKVRRYNEYVRKLLNKPALIEAGEYLISSDTYELNGNIVFRNQEEIKVVAADDIIQTDPTTGITYQILTCASNSYSAVRVKRAMDFDFVSRWIKYYSKEKDYSSLFKLKAEYMDLRPLYSCTAHKSQGSTYEEVFIDLEDICSNNRIDEVKRLLLVAITRASHKVYFKGQIPSKYLL